MTRLARKGTVSAQTLLGCVLAAALIAGCGGDDDGDAGEKTTTEPSKTTTTGSDDPAPKKKKSSDKKKSSGKGTNKGTAGRCEKAPKTVAKAIRVRAIDKPEGLIGARMVHSKDKPEGAPGSLGEEMFIVSATFKTRSAVGTWAVDDRVVDNGRGAVVPLNSSARISTKPDAVASEIGLDEKTDGYTASRLCAAAAREG